MARFKPSQQTPLHIRVRGPQIAIRAGPAFSRQCAGTTPQAIVDYRPSLEAQQRVAELIAREKEGGLSPEEQSELDHFIDLEHVLGMAKGRARQILICGS